MSFFYVPSSMIGQCGGKADERCVEIRKRELVLSLRRGSRILRGRLKRMHRLIILGGQRLIRYIGRLVSLSLNCEPRGRGVATIVFQSTREDRHAVDVVADCGKFAHHRLVEGVKHQDRQERDNNQVYE